MQIEIILMQMALGPPPWNLRIFSTDMSLVVLVMLWDVSGTYGSI